jgi:hypothetical protein
VSARADIDLSRPRNLSELIEATLQLWARHKSVLFTVALVFAGPAAIISQGLSRRASDTSTAITAADLRSYALIGLFTAIEVPLITGAYARAVERYGDGETVTVGIALRDGLRWFWAVFLALLLAGLATLGAFCLLFLPGIWLAVRVAFVGQAAAVDRAGARAAFRAAMAVTKGSWWRVFGILALVTVVELIAVTLLSLPFAAIGGGAELAAAALIQALVTSISTVIQTLLFFDLRARHTRAAAAAAGDDAWG